MDALGRHLRALLLVVCLALVAGCGTGSGSAIPPSPTGSQVALDEGVPISIAPEKPAPAPNAGRPNRLTIPALGIDVSVVPIGLTGNELVPPSDPQVVGWWKGGAVPGAAKGSAVLTGHTVSTGGGAFNDLKKLRSGERVTLWTSRGKIRYRIVAVVYYSRAELARLSGQLFSQTVPGRLVLATCTAFDGRKYRGNTLVFAAPVS